MVIEGGSTTVHKLCVNTKVRYLKIDLFIFVYISLFLYLTNFEKISNNNGCYLAYYEQEYGIKHSKLQQ